MIPKIAVHPVAYKTLVLSSVFKHMGWPLSSPHTFGKYKLVVSVYDSLRLVYVELPE